nr:uncharacterized protein CTRU02_02805 [Colletotrichum truncatum]KAF6797763.1 hypothetical protein CTRU02_02805 [Colletotrichum truncatum]
MWRRIFFHVTCIKPQLPGRTMLSRHQFRPFPPNTGSRPFEKSLCGASEPVDLAPKYPYIRRCI